VQVKHARHLNWGLLAKRAGVGLIAALALYVAAYSVLPRTADMLTVTVQRYATDQDYTQGLGTSHTRFQRTFTEGATVSAARDALNGMHYEFRNANCNLGYDMPTDVYTFALVWHSVVVETYVVTSATCYWEVTTLGVPTPQTVLAGPTTWEDLLRLTGMPDWSPPSLAASVSS
jgi:hypothetical protein